LQEDNLYYTKALVPSLLPYAIALIAVATEEVGQCVPSHGN